MPLPGIVNLDAYRGDSWVQSFRFLDAPDEPHDLSGATVAAAAVNGTATRTPLVVGLNAADPGTVKLGLPTGQGALAPGEYMYDVQVTDADGTVTTWIRGVLTVVEDVTP